MDENNKQLGLRKKHFIIKKFHLITAVTFFTLIFSALIGSSFIIIFKKYIQCGAFKSGLEENPLHVSDSAKSIVPLSLSLNQTKKVEYRLPSDLKPSLYELTIWAYFNDTVEPVDFNGTVKIYFKCFKSTDKIIIHAKELEIFNNTIKVQHSVDNQIRVKSLGFDYEREFCIIELSNQLKKDENYTLFIQYRGYIKEDNIGFYRSSYHDNDGKRRWLIASQMQPTEARKAFPSFDEPAMKAKFKIKVVHNKDYAALSNMPILTTRASSYDPNLHETNFEESIPMSTYLVAILISDFKCKYGLANAGPIGKVNMSVCARPNAFNQLDYSLALATKVIENYENYFDIDYSIKKCDNVALPDFLLAAMENWGLITYREINLVYDEKTTPDYIKQNINVMIFHELAHMWFGNIVSPEWWNDLWLSEGFATYMEYKLSETEGIDIVYNTFQIDSIASSHPISVEVNKPSEINEFFDEITYFKGSLLIRMMNYFLGEETFRRGVKRYLNKFQYGNAKQEDLWESFQEQVNFENKLHIPNIKNIMTTWTRQMGHPVINVKIINETKMILTQNHFLLDPSTKITEFGVHNSLDYKWYVPFTFSIESIRNADQNKIKIGINELYQRVEWLGPEDEIKIINLSIPIKSTYFILGNLEMSGFFRVNYDLENWDKIISQLWLNKDVIPVINRAQIVNDIFSFAENGLIEITKPFELINYLIKETEYLPWFVAVERIRYISDMLESSDYFSNLQEYLIRLIRPIYNRIGWEEKKEDSVKVRSLRFHILNYACEMGLDNCIEVSKKLFNTWMESKDNKVISPNFGIFVCCTAIRYGSIKEWEFASEQYDNEIESSAKDILQQAMSCTKEPWLIRRYLNDQLNETKVRKQDSIRGIISASRTMHGNLIAWNFLKENWLELFDRYGTNIGFNSLISDLTSKFNTNYQLDDFESFFTKNENLGTAKRETLISIEKIKSNIKWHKNNIKKLKQWLKANLCAL